LVSVRPGWNSSSGLTKQSFDEKEFDRLQAALVDGESLAVRLPIEVKTKRGEKFTCSFDVHLQRGDELDRAEQAVIRRDLLIGEEPIRAAGLKQRARGLTLIEDEHLVALLLAAEEPTISAGTHRCHDSRRRIELAATWFRQ
jgi:hypothetical protein